MQSCSCERKTRWRAWQNVNDMKIDRPLGEVFPSVIGCSFIQLQCRILLKGSHLYCWRMRPVCHNLNSWQTHRIELLCIHKDSLICERCSILLNTQDANFRKSLFEISPIFTNFLKDHQPSKPSQPDRLAKPEIAYQDASYDLGQILEKSPTCVLGSDCYLHQLVPDDWFRYSYSYSHHHCTAAFIRKSTRKAPRRPRADHATNLELIMAK